MVGTAVGVDVGRTVGEDVGELLGLGVGEGAHVGLGFGLGVQFGLTAALAWLWTKATLVPVNSRMATKVARRGVGHFISHP